MQNSQLLMKHFETIIRDSTQLSFGEQNVCVCTMTSFTIFVLMCLNLVTGAPPLKLTFDCASFDSRETVNTASLIRENSVKLPSRNEVESICSIIHNILPKSVNDGKFILIGEPSDQSGLGNDFLPVTVPPPLGFVPKYKVPRIKVPKFKVPALKPAGPFNAPRIGAPRIPFRQRDVYEQSSAERMENFKKGVQKMLHVVKVLGQIDQYVSERTRIIVDILSRTFSEPSSS